MVRESQKRASKKYQDEKTKVVTIKFGPNDSARLEHLKEQDNVSAYIKGLIDDDMQKR